jgi:hypothetical protein
MDAAFSETEKNKVKGELDFEKSKPPPQMYPSLKIRILKENIPRDQ